MGIVIQAKDLSKAYQLGDYGTGTLSRDFERYWARVRGKADPFLPIDEVNDRTAQQHQDMVWSLKGLDFEIARGDTVGIIGRNGAGKSTLLKILSRVTSPTTGSVRIKGRIASLLEVGTGFHPELTGRENIYLNGAILGMTRKEISRKFDEIVEFSGVALYIDTPVKRYSSGMYVRLAFAVAAHLESEILIVDEVLAVGDAEFQKKCLGKMGEINKGQGRTVLFVSHNMTAIQKLCNSAIFLNQGRLAAVGPTSVIITKYLANADFGKAVFSVPLPDAPENTSGYITAIHIEDQSGTAASEIPVGSPWQVRVLFTLNQSLTDFVIALGLNNATELPLRTSWSKKTTLGAGHYEAIFKEELIIYAPGHYYLTIGASSNEKTFQFLENIATVTISDITSGTLSETILKIDNVGLLLNPMPIIIRPLKGEAT